MPTKWVRHTFNTNAHVGAPKDGRLRLLRLISRTCATPLLERNALAFYSTFCFTKDFLNSAFLFIDRYPPPDRYASDRYGPPPDRYAPPPERDRYAAPTDRYRYPPSSDRYDARASGGGSSDRYGYSREYDTRRDYDSSSYYSSGNGYSTSGYSSASRGPMEKDPYGGSGGGNVGGGYGGGGGGYGGAGQNVEGSISYPTGYSTATADQSSSYGHY